MNFETWLMARGFGVGELDALRLESLREIWLSEISATADALSISGPYASEHAARLVAIDTLDADSFRRTSGSRRKLFGRVTVPSTIGVVWAKKQGPNGSKAKPSDRLIAASLRFPVIRWTASRARAWLKKNRVPFKKFEAAKDAKSSAALRQAGSAQLEAGGGEVRFRTVPVELFRAAGKDADDKPKLATFSMVAYTGGTMIIGGWWHPVVIDLDGMKVSARGRPVLKDHDRNKIVGHTTEVAIVGRKIKVSGVVSGTGEAAREVVDTAGNGFPWRVSVGARVDKMVFVEAGSKASANGQTFKGPVYVARKSQLGEVSFVALAADDATAAKVAAAAPNRPRIEVGKMEFEQWLKARGFEVGDLSDVQRETMEAAWKADQAEPEPEPKPTPTPEPTPTPSVVTAEAVQTIAATAGVAAVAAERTRVDEITAACKGFEGARVDELREKALRCEITADDLRAGLLEHVRSTRSTVEPNGVEADAGRKTLLAIGYRAAGLDEKRIAAMLGEPAVDKSLSLRSLRLQEFCAMAARLDGVELPRFGDDPKAWLVAGFSTMSLPGILSNVANKSLLEGYNYVEAAWREVGKIATLSDFKTHTRYRMTGDFQFQQVAADGELTHGELAEQDFTNKAETFGRMFQLTRQAIINDDLGAFAALPGMIGRGAGEAINVAFWTLLLSNPGGFFSAPNGNLLTGAGSALSIDALTAAVAAFLVQTKPNGHPVGIVPDRLLVPPALKVVAEQLYSDLFVNESTTANKPKPNKNPHSGQYRPVTSAYLSDATIPNSGTAHWWLFADPRNVAAMEVGFLNGRDAPTVESADADFNVLGIQFRGFIDFGVAMQDYRGANKSVGA